MLIAIVGALTTQMTRFAHLQINVLYIEIAGLINLAFNLIKNTNQDLGSV
jgi:hypothetical protein